MNDEILQMATDFLHNNGAQDSAATEVHYDGDGQCSIYYTFPTNNGGTKTSRWTLGILDLLAFVHSQK